MTDQTIDNAFYADEALTTACDPAYSSDAETFAAIGIGRALLEIAAAIRDSTPKPVTVDSEVCLTRREARAAEDATNAAAAEAIRWQRVRAEKAEAERDAILDELQDMRNRWQQSVDGFNGLTTPTEYNRGAVNVTRRTVEALTAIIERRFIVRHAQKD